VGSCAPHTPLASTRLSVALRRRPPANRRQRRALGPHALAREGRILTGAGETFPRSFQLSQFAECCAHNFQAFVKIFAKSGHRQ